ncbi:hypothetical protein Hanom_Chr16g01521761 [Helianthus anomalus]
MEAEGSCRFDSNRGEEELHASNVDPTVVDLGNMQEEREKGGEGEAEGDLGSPWNLCNLQNGPLCVDPVRFSEEGGPKKIPLTWARVITIIRPMTDLKGLLG